ncbi:glycosyl hydrolase 2 galactose-binding domain-containing protein [Cerasicoccus fimbriatus]|uniref:glycosyl hydrolase 2 galactose-binding domain-containing protein n=1 Tax=Cerasicoccus fimbriatus TaxID=3014554 RepID=UPI0022B2FADC|nr:glycoside hydrolase family 2 protein [Cerasicoccus sp. TK19100]
MSSPPTLTPNHCLNQNWEFRQAGEKTSLQATVPGCVHTDLLSHGLIPDPFCRRNEHDLLWVEQTDWQYRTSITLTEADLAAQHVSAVDIYTVFDGVKAASGELSWQVWSVAENKLLLEESKAVKLTPGKPISGKKLDLAKQVESHSFDDLIIRTRLTAEGYEDSVNTTCLTGPKRLEFQLPKIKTKVAKASDGAFAITLSTDKIAYRVYLNLDGAIPHRLSDNFFDLFPGEEKNVTLRLFDNISVAEVRKRLTVYSYRESYLD